MRFQECVINLDNISHWIVKFVCDVGIIDPLIMCNIFASRN